jgi:hypothetical protein
MNLKSHHYLIIVPKRSLGGEWKGWLGGLGGLDPLTVRSVKAAL